jgi:glycolate oxidase FAD binding subunit
VSDRDRKAEAVAPRPASEEALADAIRAAAGVRRPLRIVGGDTRRLGHDVAGEAISAAGLAGIRLYEPGALTMVAGAGTPLAEIEAALAAQGQRLPFEPWDGRALYGRTGAPTIGGVVAVNASGPRRLQAGACRDSLLGLRFVDGTGAIVKSGGRVMKNVTGLDLVKLLCGSHGTLGVITEVAFKVLPKPESAITLAFDGLSDDAAVAVMVAATATPYEVTGAAHVPRGLSPRPLTMLRVEGFPAQADYRANRLAAALAHLAPARRVEGDADDWAFVRDARRFADHPGDVWRYSVRPSEGARVGAAVRAITPRSEVFYDWAGGLVWALTPEHTYGREALRGIGGHATLMRAGPETMAHMGVFHPQPAPLARIEADLRARFDPAGVLNPGRMDGGPAARAVA